LEFFQICPSEANTTMPMIIPMGTWVSIGWRGWVNPTAAKNEYILSTMEFIDFSFVMDGTTVGHGQEPERPIEG
jgi:hypothetical protein